MLKKFIHGFCFGAGMGIALVTIWLIAVSYVIPTSLEKMTDKMTNKSLNMSGAREAKVIPRNKISSKDRKYTLHKGSEIERKIPSGGGMLSISVLEDDGQQERPSTFQGWVTESEAFIISTKEDTPTIKKVDYPKSKAVDYASKLVIDNIGFRKENMTLTISGDDVAKLKNGQSTDRCDFYNGIFRITEEGVVFLLPNKYEHNQANSADAKSSAAD
jgi:hypothetical protein